MIEHQYCPSCERPIRLRWEAVSVDECVACSLLFRNPTPSDMQLARIYDRSWSDAEVCTDETGAATIALTRAYAHKLLKSLSLRDFKGLKILDFGAGRGSMLAALSELGADVYAVDPFGYEYLRQKGFKAYRSLDEVPQGLHFDGIVTMDVIEHLHEPWKEISRLRTLLDPSGWIYISTPNAGGIKARILGPRWREAKKDVHLMFFTPLGLETILSRCGFARHQRVKWFIRFSKNPFDVAMHYSFQALSIDGVLRYLAWKK